MEILIFDFLYDGNYNICMEGIAMAKLGRPKSDVIKDKVVSVRLKPEEYVRLKEYADSLHIKITEVMVNGIKEIIFDK